MMKLKTVFTLNIETKKLVKKISNDNFNFSNEKGLEAYWHFIKSIDDGFSLEDLLSTPNHPYAIFIKKYNDKIKKLRKQSDNGSYHKDEKGNITWIGSNYMGEPNYKNIFKKHYELFIDIKKNGIKSPVSIIYNTLHKGSNNYIFEGWHRMTIAMYLKYKSVKVNFDTDVPEMEELCKIAFNIYSKEKYSIYQPIELPFFDFVKVHSNSHDKLITIKKLLDNKLLKNKKIIDFGCLSGFYIRQLKKDNIKAIGIEYHKDFYRMGILVANLLSIDIDIRHESVQNFIKYYNGNDILIALSFFHHWFKTKDFWNYFSKTMMPWIAKNIHTMIIDVIQFNDETQMLSAYKQMTQDEVLDFYKISGKFNYVHEIEQNKWGSRKLFILSKDNLNI